MILVLLIGSPKYDLCLSVNITQFNFVCDFRTACAFCYYGVVLMTTELFEASERRCGNEGNMEMRPVDTCTADCRQLNTQDYMDLLWTTLAEFPGL